ncbi:hypothetical protein F5972_29400 [Microbispora cellulosiformans]|uniref:Uncharacterized protein n=1 Tax=Microbispora cellulosiformans TaxID=2614688 RepID=A0A5J5JUE5_9ACTN|nr:hypothetical protein [Microbispora cellulosiformans]KAA9375072.1 hypothetical protein F5972_29400 [Microbispora cellulosiformans]
MTQRLMPRLQLPLTVLVKTLTLDTCWMPANVTALLAAGAFTLRRPVATCRAGLPMLGEFEVPVPPVLCVAPRPCPPP